MTQPDAINQPIITTRNVYHVAFRGKTKMFNDPKWIPGWIAKRVLLGLLDECHARIGEWEDEDPWGHTFTHTVYEDYGYYKPLMLQLIEQHGIEEAERMMRKELEDAW